MERFWWWIIIGSSLGLLGVFLGWVENYNFRKIVKQFSRGDYSLALKRMAEEEKDCLINKKILLLFEGAAKRQVKTLNLIILSLAFYNGEYEEFFSLVEESNYENRFRVDCFLLCIFSLIEKDFSSAQEHLDKFRVSPYPSAAKESSLLFLESMFAYQRGDVASAKRGAESLATSKNLFIKHICACILEGKAVEPFRLPEESIVRLTLLSVEKKKRLQKIWIVTVIAVFFVGVLGQPTIGPA